MPGYFTLGSRDSPPRLWDLPGSPSIRVLPGAPRLALDTWKAMPTHPRYTLRHDITKLTQVFRGSHLSPEQFHVPYQCMWTPVIIYHRGPVVSLADAVAVVAPGL